MLSRLGCFLIKNIHILLKTARCSARHLRAKQIRQVEGQGAPARAHFYLQLGLLCFWTYPAAAIWSLPSATEVTGLVSMADAVDGAKAGDGRPAPPGQAPLGGGAPWIWVILPWPLHVPLWEPQGEPCKQGRRRGSAPVLKSVSTRARCFP